MHVILSWKTEELQNVVQMKINTTVIAGDWENKTTAISNGFEGLDAYSVESVEKGLLYEVYNHYLHYSIFMSASTRTTIVPATVFLQTWNGFEIDPL